MSAKLLYSAAKYTLVEYLNKTSLNGCYLLYYIRRRKYQRLFWFMFIAMAVTFAIYVCKTTLMAFLKDPTVTTIDTQLYSVYEVPFPSVAVCSNNKFSHQAIRRYSWDISLRSSHNESLDFWQHKLEILSGLYNYDSIDFEQAIRLHNDLEVILGETFKTAKLLEMLAPKCEDLIVKCYWAEQIINCKENFVFKILKDGPCCVFNYQYMKNVDTLFYPNSTGQDAGLIILLNSTTIDYFYAEDNNVGFNIKLFSTQRMPDINMGGIEEFHVDPGEDVNVKLYLLSQVAMADISVYDDDKLGCYFNYDHKTPALEKSECLLICKQKLIESKCECTPFYGADLELKGHEAKKQCSLLNLACLAYFKDDLLDSLRCNCLPACSYVRYKYHKTANQLRYSFRNHRNKQFIGEIDDISPELSLVKIFYNTESATRYYKNVLFKWYHILSNIGGVIGICMGCSIISGIEIIYFGCFRLMENFFKLKK